jgi:uncharacterized protein
MIERSIKKEIKELLSYFPVVGMVGARQVGKTTLAKEILKELDKPSIYLDLELPEDLNKLTEPDLFLTQYQNYCVILDEVQRVPRLFPVLRSLIDQNRLPGRFFLLGSASPDLIRDASESLAGRIVYKQLAPLHLLEIHQEITLENHWLRGGFPDSLLAPLDKLSNTWRRSFVQSYVERDLALLGLNANPSIIRKFWTMLSHFHGNVWNAQSFARSLGVTSPTISRYLHFMEQAYLVFTLPSYNANVKKRLIKAPKVYIRDSGILHHLTGIQSIEQLYGNVLAGASWEGYVIEQIRNVLDDDKELYFYRTHEGTECDLVIVEGGYPKVAVEIKFTNAPKVSKGFYIAIEDLKTENNFVITPSSESYPLSENVRVCNLFSFLNKIRSWNELFKD